MMHTIPVTTTYHTSVCVYVFDCVRCERMLN